jgi:hypothetical protein
MSKLRGIVKTEIDSVLVDFSDLGKDDCIAIYFSDTDIILTICNDGEGFFRVEKRQVIKG